MKTFIFQTLCTVIFLCTALCLMLAYFDVLVK